MACVLSCSTAPARKVSHAASWTLRPLGGGNLGCVWNGGGWSFGGVGLGGGLFKWGSECGAWGVGLGGSSWVGGVECEAWGGIWRGWTPPKGSGARRAKADLSCNTAFARRAAGCHSASHTPLPRRPCTARPSQQTPNWPNPVNPRLRTVLPQPVNPIQPRSTPVNAGQPPAPCCPSPSTRYTPVNPGQPRSTPVNARTVLPQPVRDLSEVGGLSHAVDAAEDDDVGAGLGALALRLGGGDGERRGQA
jgi:hypothetical protein